LIGNNFTRRYATVLGSEEVIVARALHFCERSGIDVNDTPVPSRFARRDNAKKSNKTRAFPSLLFY